MALAHEMLARCSIVLLALAACAVPDPFGGGGDRPDPDEPRPDAGGGAIDAGGPRADAPPSPSAKRVFVSSLRYPARFQATIPTVSPARSADAICQSLADAARLGGTYYAWVSTTEGAAIDHVVGPGPWHRMDGELAFANRAALQTAPRVAIVFDEYGDSIGSELAWSGTNLGGRTSAATCNNWQTVAGNSATTGAATGTSTWTDRGVSDCSSQLRLYCFEQ